MFAHDITLTVGAMANSPHGVNYAVYRDGNPEFVFGALQDPNMPHMAQIWGVGTNRCDNELIKDVGQFIKTDFTSELIRNGVRRAEVRVMADNRSSRMWLTRWLGARFETELPNFGRNGETFVQMSWQHTEQ